MIEGEISFILSRVFAGLQSSAYLLVNITVNFAIYVPCTRVQHCAVISIGDFDEILLINLAMLGLVTWETIIQLPVDWYIVSRKVCFGS